MTPQKMSKKKKNFEANLGSPKLTQIYRNQKQTIQKMCQTEDLLIRQQQEYRIEKYQKNLLKLTRKTKTNHCKKIF